MARPQKSQKARGRKVLPQANPCAPQAVPKRPTLHLVTPLVPHEETGGAEADPPPRQSAQGPLPESGCERTEPVLETEAIERGVQSSFATGIAIVIQSIQLLGRRR